MLGVALVVLVGFALAGVGSSREPARPSAAIAAPATVSADRPCDRFASPAGRDSWPGTRRRPFRTLGRLKQTLGPGRVACLRSGRYSGDVKLTRGGDPANRAVLRAYRNERVTVAGRLWVAAGTDDLSIAGLYLDGRNDQGLPSPTVNADRVSFIRVDVTNHHTGICFILGSREYGAAEGTRIQASRIHDCGRLPRTNLDHGFYLEEARGTRIVGNWIYDNADHGVQLYPNADRTVIRGNVITRNGSGIILSGAGGLVSTHNLIERNVISDSEARFNVEYYYPRGNPIGRRNRVVRNCVSGGVHAAGMGGLQIPPVGYRLDDNVVAEPNFRDPQADDFRVGGRCRSILGRRAMMVPGP